MRDTKAHLVAEVVRVLLAPPRVGEAVGRKQHAQQCEGDRARMYPHVRVTQWGGKGGGGGGIKRTIPRI